ncbi:B3/B4 domain-containing protein (DNA/RNA-binding domain of Phe-tRNA-synthetase) [Pilibacter termitis]|uniref:B3/B4 domain-containing protein (DNA/RNA-binding domain of Phe-tRNA-synthetase) n=1 Tax=Pilibacter termitis TaxID=263852 RepID=A0A1T4QFE7_9ENTE|nr:phenylalanine--tRNA ligase beta subunit-related protein [Pilibacter termitis]SKA02366.1 B3/B4 domain-containing protein (DNA/RNA-binding domain of Phe-tRNA-synthetase) [Pilibacter termitis]
MEFRVDKRIFERIPELQIGVLILENIDNTKNIDDFFKQEYGEITQAIMEKYGMMNLADEPRIAKWRKIYKSFGEKKARSSVEALIKRVKNGNELYRISPLVDLYNLASLKFELPCGSEDLSKMPSDLELTFATGEEEFILLGQTEMEHPNEEEIVYKSGNMIVCRNFNYRESDKTKIDSATKKAIFIFEDIDNGNLEGALTFVSNSVKHLLEANVVKKEIITNEKTNLDW